MKNGWSPWSPALVTRYRLTRADSHATLRSMTCKQIRAIRDRLGLTQTELAERVGVARNTVTRWESGTLGIKESAARLLRMLAEQSGDRRR